MNIEDLVPNDRTMFDKDQDPVGEESENLNSESPRTDVVVNAEDDISTDKEGHKNFQNGVIRCGFCVKLGILCGSYI